MLITRIAAIKFNRYLQIRNFFKIHKYEPYISRDAVTFGIESFDDWHFGILELWNFRILKRWSFRILKLWNLEILKFYYFLIFSFSRFLSSKSFPFDFFRLCFSFIDKCSSLVLGHRVYRNLPVGCLAEVRPAGIDLPLRRDLRESLIEPWPLSLSIRGRIYSTADPTNL